MPTTWGLNFGPNFGFSFDILGGEEPEETVFAGRQNRRVKVNSSNVDYVSYAKNHKELVVRFKTGEVYKYEKVPPGRIKALLSAKSTGGYLHNKIVPRYAGKRT